MATTMQTAESAVEVKMPPQEAHTKWLEWAGAVQKSAGPGRRWRRARRLQSRRRLSRRPPRRLAGGGAGTGPDTHAETVGPTGWSPAAAAADPRAAGRVRRAGRLRLEGIRV